jgi:hypothetical protein
MARPNDGATVTIWRTGITNADTVVDITTTPTLSQVSAVAFTDASGDDQGRIDITLTSDAPAGAYAWVAEIDSVEVFSGTIYVAAHGRPASFVAHSIDINSATVPKWIISRPEDVSGEALGGGPATQIDETGGPTTLDIDAIADGEYLQRVGTEIVGATPVGTGDVVGPASATDEAFARFDLTTGKLIQNSVVTCSNTGVVAGIDDLTLTGSITMSALETVDGRDISADWTTSSTHFANTSNPHSVTAAQVGAIATSAKGAASGVASLDANTRLVEAAQVLRVTGQDLSAGACTDGQFLTRSGTTYAGVTHGNSGDPHTQYQLESEKGAVSGYASLNAGTRLVEAAEKLYETGGPTTLTIGAIGDNEFLQRVGSTVVGATSTTAGLTTFGADIPTGGTNGDIHIRESDGTRWLKSGGVWAPVARIAPCFGPGNQGVIAVAARYNSTSLTSYGGATPTAPGTGAAAAYATTNARTARIRVDETPDAVANTLSSGMISAAVGVMVVDSATYGPRWAMTYEFGLSAITQSNFRWFSGFTTGATFATDPTTASGHGLGDRIGLAVDANTSLAARWIVNAANANQQNDAAYTLIENNWYKHVVYCLPNTQVIVQELWEISTAGGTYALVASTSFTATSTFTMSNLRIFGAVANAGTAAGAGTLSFGQLWGMCLN